MAIKSALLAAAFATVSQLAAAQNFPTGPAAVSHVTNFNGSFVLTPAQIESAQFDNETVASIQVIMNFDHTQMAFGGTNEDDFYTLPPLVNGTNCLKPGQVLKVQAVTNTSAYALPPFTALSRIMYTTTNFNGTVIPATGFILWPYTPRKFGNSEKPKTILWAHGTSGFFGPQAPSAHRSLWYDNQGPFTLAAAGYAVFAPDFAGLGVSKSWDGSRIPHQYHVGPATAGDALYGMRAALQAFPDSLGEEYIVMGHSQGGGVAWSVAEALVLEEEKYADLVSGYKGSVPVSPTTEVHSGPGVFMATSQALMLDSIFPSFTLDEWMTPLGIARIEFFREVEAGNAAIQRAIIGVPGIYHENYAETWYASAISRLGNAGRKDFKGPMLVVQGSEDAYVPYNVTARTVEATWELNPDNDLEFLIAPGVGHVPVLPATRHLWLDWIEDRFAGVPLANNGSARTDLESMLPVEQYQHTFNSFPLWNGLPVFSYEMPLSV